MRESIGSVFLYNVVIIFIVIIFGFVGALITYTKAYKVNSKITGAIEENEGYNSLAKTEIERSLSTLGYRVNDGKKCPTAGEGETLLTDVNDNTSHRFCVYQTKVASKGDPYDAYRVVTYIFIDMPFIDEFTFAVKSATNEIFRFGLGG